MWNNTRLLNLLANLMFVVAAAIVAKLIVIASLNSPRFPVRTVRVVGDVAQVPADQLADAFAGRAIGNFFAADLAAVREWVEGVPWVRRAAVRRVWPDRLEVTVQAHRALGRWSDRELIDVNGEVFAAESREPLPALSGPAGSEHDVAERYFRFRDILARIDQPPAGVTLTPRFAWEVRLPAGTVLALGRDGPRESAEDRLIRFIRLYPGLAPRLAQPVDYIDLRYPNGFAVRAPDLPALLKDTAPLPAEPRPAGDPVPARHAALSGADRPA